MGDLEGGAGGGRDRAGLRFTPSSQEQLAPSGAKARVTANLEALHVLAALEREQRAATVAEQRTLARWSSWGAVPAIFDEERAEWAEEREQLKALLDGDRYAAARRTTINAHYTDPAIVREIWKAAGALGFTGGRVLEPGAGAGVFIGLAPAGAEMTGVELDRTTAGIAQALYPDASIRAESFAGTRLPDGYFDLVVGNVPFADVVLHDPRHNRGRHSIHNHFLVKSLCLTRPGGLVAVLTSRYTLDAGNPAARREMNDLGELLGAVRLPTGAHRRAAGTDAVTDLLILRRREPGAEASPAVWETTREVTVDGHEIRINSYYAEHPENVLGELEVGHGMYDAQTLHVRGPRDPEALSDALSARLAAITADARRAGLTLTVSPEAGLSSGSEARRTALEPSEGLWDGHITAQADGTFTTVIGGAHEPFDVPRTARVEVRELLGLRDCARRLLEEEAASVEDSDSLDALRRELHGRYTTYAARYGPINRFTRRSTGRIDPDTREVRMARITPRAVQVLSDDPFVALVHALEVFDDDTQTARPATMLRERVLVARTPVLGADNASDALAICLDTHGRVELTEIAALLGQDAQDARAALGELVYEDPAVGALVPAAEYLSGNVRERLDVAREAARTNPALAVNVAALERALPPDLGMDEVQPRLGAAWIDADTHREFLSEILQDPSIKVEHPGGAIWAVRGNSYSVRATSDWGTARMPAPQIVKAVLEQRPIQITDETDDGKRVVNATETAAAQEKAQALQERFGEWVWEDPDRSTRLLAEYNRRFNSIALRDYSLDGERLTLPGVARTFSPLPHQRTAVARMISEPAVGLFHAVGAGKTAEMVIGATELRRLGLVRKPCVVVPNHMLSQFSREWLEIYPQARLLAASSEDLAGDKRRAFIARVATNDWDGVIMTSSAFARIPVSDTTHSQYLERETTELREMLQRARGGDGLTVKRLEKMVLTAEQRVQGLLDHPVDPGISFEETGVDYLLVDEAHSAKNLRTVSNIRDASIEGSKRASDLHMKLEYLRSRHGQRVATLATATPIANSITEAHVMQRYLRPDLLRAAGVEDFDAWAATFGELVTEIEMAPTGGGSYRMHTRFARFTNVPEILKLWHVFADVRTTEDLNLAIPQIAVRGDGKRVAETIVIDSTPDVRAYIEQLGHRAEQVRSGAVTPEEDNMLKICTDGRKAALDMRLATGQPTPGTSKLDVASRQIARIWGEHRDQRYTDPETGQLSPVPGAFQIVFCDLGTPSSAGWNAYDELREQLAAHGVPRAAVRFIHEASNTAEKARLFAACRAGNVAVLIGSTEKMGVGTNMQNRAVAIHHLDCPWRPADIEQRDGRGIRQGNQNTEIGIYRYVVEGSFDSYSWQTVERKAKFITQVMRGRLDVRSIEDIGDNALSFQEVKALASGDPLILEKATADADLTRLQRLQRAWQRNQNTLRHTITSARDRVGVCDQQLDALADALAQRRDTRGERFAMTIGERTVQTRPDAARLLAAWAHGAVPGKPAPVGQLGGIEIVGVVHRDLATREQLVKLALHGLPTQPAMLDLSQLQDNALSLVRQLEHRIGDLDGLAERIKAQKAGILGEAGAARDALARPFKYTAELADTQARVQRIADEMRSRQEHPEASDDRADQPPGPAEPDDLADIRRLARASFPSAPTPAPPATTPGRATPRDPDRRERSLER